MDILTQLFGSEIKVLLLRLFLENPEEKFSLNEIKVRLKADKKSVLPSVKLLEKIRFLKKESRTKNPSFRLDQAFPYFQPLKNLVLQDIPVSNEQILAQLKKAGNLKLVILSGFLSGEKDKPSGEMVGVDILIVGDKLNKKKINEVVSKIEAKLTRELNYTVFSTNEFLYRRNMADSFLRNVFALPHIKILNKLGI